jgi:DNA-binding beta-propeller fold protein YncE
VGTVDLDGAPEQAVTDGKGHIYVDIEDKDNVAAVDAKTLAVTAHYDLGGKGGTPAGLAFDAKNKVLFVACRKPAVFVMMNSDTGKILDTQPIGNGSDGALFNPKTMEAFSSHSDGTLSIIKEKSPTSFEVEQTVQTMRGAKTSTLDTKTGNVLLIAAEYGPPPAPTPGAEQKGGRGGRAPMLPDSFTILVVGK